MPVLTEKEKIEIRDVLDVCKRPLFFFHDDPDGLASFCLFYRYKREGKGHVVKAVPHITTAFLRYVNEYVPDALFILDIAMVDQDFLDGLSIPVVWIDHHEVLVRDRVNYYNPRKSINKNVPTPYMCYEVVGDDLWLATLGCIGDWYLPDFSVEFSKLYPAFLPVSIVRVEDALFSSPVSEVIKLFSFILKGKTAEVIKCINVLTRLDSFDELVKKESSRSRFLWKKFESVNVVYGSLLARAKKSVGKGLIAVFTYAEDQLSLTKDLANELLYLFPEKVIILGREREGELRMSLRAAKYLLPDALKKVLAEVGGYGGGHEHACGAAVKKEGFERFVKLLESELKKQSV